MMPRMTLLLLCFAAWLLSANGCREVKKQAVKESARSADPAISAAGPLTTPKFGVVYGVYIESWDRISFENPSITEGGYTKNHSKEQADSVIKQYRPVMSSSAEVMLGKACEINVDEIQDWLVSQGMTYIAFKRAVSSEMPWVFREYRNGKIINFEHPVTSPPVVIGGPDAR